MRLMRASFEDFMYRVTSAEMRLSKAVMSKPSSSSVDRSGLSSRLPNVLKTTAGWSPASPRAVVDEKNWTASVVPGCTPEAPYALRRRNSLSQPICGKNDSSDGIHDTEAFG